MGKKQSASFRDYFMDDENVSPSERAKIEFEVELIGKIVGRLQSRPIVLRVEELPARFIACI
jgi:hypothetical protein